uniref:terminase large subunit domain-containing protein n=1 Tax=Sphingomonas bacterium TaxID=1895847 RepID=UPI001575E7D1
MAAKRKPLLAPDLDPIAYLRALPDHLRREALALLGEQESEAIDHAWRHWAHDGQVAPAGDWATWVLIAGRGFGKTLAGTRWLIEQVGGDTPLAIALVGATREEARRVMVEGNSGLLTVGEPWITSWEPSHGRLVFTNGSHATIFSGASPDRLRGPEHHLAWCDELAKWKKARETWEMLQMTLRLGDRPRTLVTTTPRPGPVLRAIMAEQGTTVTRGRTANNPHSSAAWRARMDALYGGTRLGRQELDGELLPEAGALWSPALIERCRARDAVPSMTRTLIAVDPPVGDGTCGIVAVGRAGVTPGTVAHVLADHSVTARSPEGWARAVA